MPHARTIQAGLAAAALSLGAGAAPGVVNLEFRILSAQPTIIGQQVDVGLFAVAQTPGNEDLIAALEVVMGWEASSLGLVGIVPGGAAFAFSGFPIVGASGLNEAVPPADGDALFVGFASLGTPITATAPGTLLATFRFDATQLDAAAAVDILASGGFPTRSTTVFDGTLPNTVITGTLTSTSAVVTDCGPADLDHNGLLNVDDIAIFATGFVSSDPVADTNGDTVFNLDDIETFVFTFLAGCP